MQIVVDSDLKSKLEKDGRIYKKSICFFWMLDKFVLFASIAYIVLFPVYCKITGDFIGTAGRDSHVDYSIVVIFTIAFGLGLLTLWFCVHILRRKLEQVRLGGRVFDTIELKDNLLYYTFRVPHQTLVGYKNLVVLDLNSIQHVGYDEKTRKIDIEGNMFEEIIKISEDEKKVKISEMKSCDLEIYDYFTPSLYEKLKIINS